MPMWCILYMWFLLNFLRQITSTCYTPVVCMRYTNPVHVIHMWCAWDNNKYLHLIFLGDYTDPDVALTHCTRLLCSSYLLTGYSGGQLPDRHVRVSVKALAIGCVACIVGMYPKVFYTRLFKSCSADNSEDGKWSSCDILEKVMQYPCGTPNDIQVVIVFMWFGVTGHICNPRCSIPGYLSQMQITQKTGSGRHVILLSEEDIWYPCGTLVILMWHHYVLYMNKHVLYHSVHDLYRVTWIQNWIFWCLRGFSSFFHYDYW